MGIPVAVEWIDTTPHNGWLEAEDTKDLHCSLVTTIGFMTSINDMEIVVSCDMEDGGTYNGHSVIPIVNITNLTFLTEIDEGRLTDGKHLLGRSSRRRQQAPPLLEEA